MSSNSYFQSHAATHFGLDCEDFAEAVQFDRLCDQAWPIWVVYRNDQPVGWWDESAEIAHIS